MEKGWPFLEKGLPLFVEGLPLHGRRAGLYQKEGLTSFWTRARLCLVPVTYSCRKLNSTLKVNRPNSAGRLASIYLEQS